MNLIKPLYEINSQHFFHLIFFFQTCLSQQFLIPCSLQTSQNSASQIYCAHESPGDPVKIKILIQQVWRWNYWANQVDFQAPPLEHSLWPQPTPNAQFSPVFQSPLLPYPSLTAHSCHIPQFIDIVVFTLLSNFLSQVLFSLDSTLCENIMSNGQQGGEKSQSGKSHIV